MIDLTFLNDGWFRWYGFAYRGDLRMHWYWALGVGSFVTFLVVYVWARLRAASRAAIEGAPYKAKAASLEATLATVKEGHAIERDALKRQVTEATGNLPHLLEAINRTLGPSYPAQSTVTAIEGLKEYEQWGRVLTARLRKISPRTWKFQDDNFFAHHQTREAVAQFLIDKSSGAQEAIASKDDIRETLQKKDEVISSLERTTYTYQQQLTAQREEIARLQGLITQQKIKISQLETEIPALNDATLKTVARMSRDR